MGTLAANLAVVFDGDSSHLVLIQGSLEPVVASKALGWGKAGIDGSCCAGDMEGATFLCVEFHRDMVD